MTKEVTKLHFQRKGWNLTWYGSQKELPASFTLFDSQETPKDFKRNEKGKGSGTYVNVFADGIALASDFVNFSHPLQRVLSDKTPVITPV